ncbi:MAG: COG4315 family predicted lipoprotein [Candidatus Limnocylindria bacterium]
MDALAMFNPGLRRSDVSSLERAIDLLGAFLDATPLYLLTFRSRSAAVAMDGPEQVVAEMIRPHIDLTKALVVSAVTLALSACGGGGTTSVSTSPRASTPAATSSAGGEQTGGVLISAGTIAGLGPVLVDTQGHTLYVFEPDAHAKVTCLQDCAKVWPPASLPAGQKAVAGGEVKASLLGSDPDPDGGQVITYAGWPLYAYVGDASAGQHNGQALNLNGGLWYVISPAGSLITTKP